MTTKNLALINEQKQAQMLKLVTKSFYKELINYGIDKKNILVITAHLLDHIMDKDEDVTLTNGYYNREFKIEQINDRWKQSQELIFRDVRIARLHESMIPQVVLWLKNPIIKYNFIPQFPETEKELRSYFLEDERGYFAIYYKDEHVGIIGADYIDYLSSKLEMRKFIGDFKLHGKGIGKSATFLFLYYSFIIQGINKVYIYSADTNIKNLNINSRFGFELEGIFLEDFCLGKEKRDIVRMGLLRSQWQEIFCKQ
jgi:RimJ/RimL family protein N-acetyltransferase